MDYDPDYNPVRRRAEGALWPVYALIALVKWLIGLFRKKNPK